MARIDKITGSFRAPLGDAIETANVGKLLGVGISASGTVELGASDSGIIGVICADHTFVIGETIDVVTVGEIVCSDGEEIFTSAAAGDVVFSAAADGVLSTTSTGTRVAHLVESWRAIVHVYPIPSDYFGS